jgi:exodeoxyribonuclease VII large subunit
VSVVVGRAAQVIREKAPPLWVRGEVSGWKRLRSGHCYFTLKDDKAELRCTIWDRTARLLPALPADGMEVDVFGQLTIYTRRGQFQMEVMEVASTGIGGLWQVAKERLVAQLRGEGLLEEERKRPLPEYPERVGIVTSVQSAVLHDMHRTLRRKAWWIPVLVSHSGVEGAAAAREVAEAIRRFGTRRDSCLVDVVIVARGGGSMESLWGFNLEPVARAIAACPVPVISAVGHETDYTVADLVADYRAATPTAGAERAVPDGRQIASRVQAWPGELQRRVTRAAAAREAEVTSGSESIRSGVAGRLRFGELHVTEAGRHLEARNPRQAWLRASERIEDAAADLDAAMSARLEAQERSVAAARPALDDALLDRLTGLEQEFVGAVDALEARSPLRVLARGYAMVTDPETDRPLRSVHHVRPNARLRVRLADGELAVRVEPDPAPPSDHAP